jgi:hypothetical protein
MRNKIEILSEELQNHFSGIAVDLFEILFPELTKEGLLLPPMRGRGFFPGADGLWKEDKDRDLRPFPYRPIMFVGQDFDKEAEKGEYLDQIHTQDYQEEPREGKGSATWRNQLLRLKLAGISPADCFHTNLFPGLRISTKNYGTSTALRYPSLVDSCVEFLSTQIKIVEPRAVIFLGYVPASEVFYRWLPGRPNFQSGIDIDEARSACFSLKRGAEVIRMGWMTHPSLGDANSRRRKYNGHEGVAAEQSILKECAAE